MKRRRFPLLSRIGRRWTISAGFSIPRKLASASICVVWLFAVVPSCEQASRTAESVTITLLDPGWLDRTFLEWRNHEVEQFRRETGVRVRLLPAPETAVDQLTLWRRLFDDPVNAPDVFAIDVIWPPVMAPYALRLDPALSEDTSADFPYLVSNNTVGGALVAMPYHIDSGLLFYRTDLLHEYGYRGPPETWNDLEAMAARIQKGERSKGKKDFWGFVWQGAASEALTCNALEWQVSDGGGSIVDANGAICLNSPNVVRAWERAARWVGTISPPSVTAYREWDALNVWRSGNAAFMRNWPTSYVTSRTENSVVGQTFGVTLLPAGANGHTGAFGGASLSIFRNTKHAKEALALVRFLCRRDVQRARALVTSQPPTFPDLYDDPEVLKANPHFAELKRLFLGPLAKRPSAALGDKYVDASKAYSDAVHSVLVGEKKAPAAARQLEDDLVQLTGLARRAPDQH